MLSSSQMKKNQNFQCGKLCDLEENKNKIIESYSIAGLHSMFYEIKKYQFSVESTLSFNFWLSNHGICIVDEDKLQFF